MSNITARIAPVSCPCNQCKGLFVVLLNDEVLPGTAPEKEAHARVVALLANAINLVAQGMTDEQIAVRLRYGV